MKGFSLTSKQSYVKLFDYDNILLKTYFQISESNDLQLLVISGKPTEDQLLEAWETLIHTASEQNGDNRYSMYLVLLKAYAAFIAKHVEVASMLLIMTYEKPYTKEWQDRVRLLKRYGYNIALENNDVYWQSLKNAKQSSSNLVTKAEMKRKEIERMFKVGKDGKKKAPMTFEQTITNLEFALGEAKVMMPINSDTITLSKFNTLKKLIKQKHESSRTNND